MSYNELLSVIFYKYSDPNWNEQLIKSFEDIHGENFSGIVSTWIYINDKFRTIYIENVGTNIILSDIYILQYLYHGYMISVLE